MIETEVLSRNIWVFIIGFLLIVHSSHGQLTLQDIRLVGGSSEYEGRLEVKYNNTWGTVCLDHFETAEAEVVCRQLQYTGGTAVTDGQFGEGTGRIWLDNLGCEGSEQSLATCQANNIGQHNCGHSDDAGVICEPQTQSSTLNRGPAVAQPSICPGSTDPQIRLVGPNDTVGVGFVEVKHNGIWGAVCDDHWDINDAKVVCGSLCFNKSLSLTGTTHSIDYVKATVSPNFLLDDVQCSGSETDIFNCPHSGIGLQNCQAGEYASVTCTAIERTAEHPPAPLLSCENEQFTVSFSRAYDPGLSYGGVTVNTTSPCTPKYSNTSAYIEVEISFNDCGTEISSNASHIFYDITLAYNINSVGIITRKNFYYVKLTCEFLRNKTNEAGYTAEPNEVTKSSTGEFIVGMLLFEDENFNIPLTESPTLQMNQPLSASLNLETTLDHLKIVVRTCFATPSGTWTDTLNYDLFRDNCANDDTVALIPLNETSSGFRFRSFKFIGREHIYLHCISVVCEVDEKDELCDRSCKQTVTAGRRRRRSSRKKRNDVTFLYSTSQILTVIEEVDDPIIERFTTKAGTESRTIYPSTTSRPSNVSSSSPTNNVTVPHSRPTRKETTPTPGTTIRATSFSTLRPISSSVEVFPGSPSSSVSPPTEQNLVTEKWTGVPEEEATLLVGTLSSAPRVLTSLFPLVTMAMLTRIL